MSKKAENRAVLLSDYRPTPYAVQKVSLDFHLETEACTVESEIQFAAREGTGSGVPLVLDGEELELISAALDGATISEPDFEVDEQSFTLKSPPSGPFNLRFKVRIDPKNNTSLMGLYVSNDIWCTQCEAEGFRKITYMYDRPDVLAPYSVRISAPKALAPVLLSNGNLTEAGEEDARRHFVVFEDPHPKPTYLFALVAGDLDHIGDSFVTSEGRDVALKIYCEHGKASRCHYAMDALKRSMKWDEEKFGRAYDLDMFNIVAVSDFNSGAMENKGLNIFNDVLILADPETATDANYAAIESVVSHEYFHNWTGNRITCRDWFQLCLKEGLTVYRDQEFSADERSRSVQRIADVRTLWARQFPEDSGPLAHPPRPNRYEEIDNFYTPTVYEKGAEIVRILATLLGPERFSQGMDLYFDRHDGEATTVEAWVKVFEDVSGRDLSGILTWYTQAGRPTVEVAEDWDEQEKSLTVTLKQDVPPTPDGEEKQVLPIPLRFGLVGADGDQVGSFKLSGATSENDLLLFDQKEMTFTIQGTKERPLLSLNRGFSAPIDLEFPRAEADLSALAKWDTDPVNRWMAMQTISRKLLIDAAQNGGDLSGDGAAILASAMENVLQSDADEPAYKAMCLSVATYREIATAMGKNVNPDHLSLARDSLQRQIGAALVKPLEQQYHALAVLAAGGEDDASAQARALRNACLRLLLFADAGKFGALAQQQYAATSNLTDRIAAVSAAVAADTAQADQLIAQFDQLSSSDALVRDKYYALVASRNKSTTLDKVKEIFSSSSFDRENPNRLRALIGSFAMQNPTQFTREDGQGFELVAEIITNVDKKNPKMASRLMNSFLCVAELNAERKQLGESVLRRMDQQDEISKDVREKLSLLLGAKK